MLSPFPGMDPFLEDPAYWSDFHARFVNAWCEAVADALPPNYEAGLGERVYLIEHDPEERKLVFPDVAITQADVPSSKPSGGGVATLEPVTIPLTILEGPRETFIEILHRPDRSLVAVLEVASLLSKQGLHRTAYLSERKERLYQQVDLVELDLLRAGRRPPLAKPLPPGDCYYLVSRAEQRPDCQVYAWGLRQPLPTLPVPLRAPDPDLMIPLAAVFNTAYDRGRFQRRIDYRGALPGHLRADEKPWVQDVIGAK
jgi:hypothetical protein